jgi:UDP-glucose 4-epimerase
MVKMLLAHGVRTVVIDTATPLQGPLTAATWDQGNLGDRELLRTVFSSHAIDTVMHFGAFIEVGESVKNPLKYYENNVTHTLTLLSEMHAHHIKQCVFSSTAAVFGEPQYVPIDEQHPIAPINPYGSSKAMDERILADLDHACGLRTIAFRYFNAAGADPDGELGECHDPESHLIPIILQVARGSREAIHVFGQDYDTPDGTCVRDYVHIVDLCQAHLLAAQQLSQGAPSNRYNLGNGQGFSVQQVIDTARQVTGKSIPQINAPRRAGDPARLIADSQKATKELGWRPQFQALDTIVQHAWTWEQKK